MTFIQITSSPMHAQSQIVPNQSSDVPIANRNRLRWAARHAIAVYLLVWRIVAAQNSKNGLSNRIPKIKRFPATTSPKRNLSG